MGDTPDRFIADLLAGLVTLGREEARLRLNGYFGGHAPLMAGVVGWPLTHTLSPILHNHWCARHGVHGTYMRLPLPPARFDLGIALLRDLGFQGLNLTIPLKEQAFRIATEKTTRAMQCGAVNTLIFRDDGAIEGDSTDGPGFCDNVSSSGVEIKGPAMVLGAGGAARAVCAELLSRGCQVMVSNRTQARAAALGEEMPELQPVAWDAWPEVLQRCQLLINTTSLGMEGHADFDWAPALRTAPETLAVCDIVYVPLVTSLLSAAQARGLKTIDGLGMLIQQARVGFKAWFGVAPDADPTTRAILLDALR